MLRDSIHKDINDSMKAGKKDRVETLRFLLAAVVNYAINKYGASAEEKISDTDVLEVIKKQVKTHKESIDAFSKAGRQELVDKEQIQLTILEEFAPKELSDEDLKKMLLPIASSSEANFGKLMGQAMATVAGKADGGRVALMLKQLISSK